LLGQAGPELGDRYLSGAESVSVRSARCVRSIAGMVLRNRMTEAGPAPVTHDPCGSCGSSANRPCVSNGDAQGATSSPAQSAQIAAPVARSQARQTRGLDWRLAEEGKGSRLRAKLPSDHVRGV